MIIWIIGSETGFDWVNQSVSHSVSFNLVCVDVNSCQQGPALTAVIILVDPCILEVDGVILGLQNLRNKESLLRSKMQNDLSISLLSENNLCSIC